MAPLVLAIEPDLRQAAIVKRIVREKVLADVTVVDSRDAALEAIRTTMPDVLLLSTLLSPRDEDELVAHLRTLQDADHLQTHTIPQLASAIAPGGDGARPAKGLLASWLRRKDTANAPAGCDPDLFAEEILSYLRRAADKKRERRDAALLGTNAAPSMTPVTPQPLPHDTPAAAPDSGSSWASPFEWRPTSTASSSFVADPDSMVAPPEPASSASVLSESAMSESAVSESAVSEPAVAEPVIFEPVIVESPVSEPTDPVAPNPVPRAPLVMRQRREWWFEEGDARAEQPARELPAFLSALAIPEQVLAITSVDGCRIRRVRAVAVVAA
jgi:CheY-like chemotaxis protein